MKNQIAPKCTWNDHIDHAEYTTIGEKAIAENEYSTKQDWYGHWYLTKRTYLFMMIEHSLELLLQPRKDKEAQPISFHLSIYYTKYIEET